MDEAIASNRGSNTIDHEKPEQSYNMVIQDAEERLRITDQQAVDELEHFKTEIHRITKANRYSVWVMQFIILLLAVTLIYLSTFN